MEFVSSSTGHGEEGSMAQPGVMRTVPGQAEFMPTDALNNQSGRMKGQAQNVQSTGFSPAQEALQVWRYDHNVHLWSVSMSVCLSFCLSFC